MHHPTRVGPSPYLREQITLKHDHESMVGESLALRKALADAERVAVTDTPVLLLGETGTGKELFAEEIHRLSTRKKKSMAVANCASLPSTLIESELFGRVAGAYTGAASAQHGRFEIADQNQLGHRQTLKECERSHILRALQDAAWRIRGPGGASELLDIKPTTLEARMAKLG
jgi:transcriptional regulator with GAF, ATPase, and Fis domain